MASTSENETLVFMFGKNGFKKLKELESILIFLSSL